MRKQCRIDHRHRRPGNRGPQPVAAPRRGASSPAKRNSRQAVGNSGRRATRAMTLADPITDGVRIVADQRGQRSTAMIQEFCILV
jgi:hypothetical protein